MSTVFVYEHLCGSDEGASAPMSLQREGRAMLGCALAELATLPNLSLRTPLHSSVGDLSHLPFVSDPSAIQVLNDRLEDPSETVRRGATGADFAWIIAPENAGLLERLTAVVESLGVPLLGPKASMVRLFADKLKTAEVLGAIAVATAPAGGRPPDWQDLVLKPRDRCGAENVVRVSGHDADAVLAELRRDTDSGEFLATSFCEGTAASVAVIAGQNRTIVLPLVLQHLECRPGFPDPRTGRPRGSTFHYLGGAVMPGNPIHRRAEALAQAVLAVAPGLSGYFGIDLTLGKNPLGDDDRIIEVNPRLTTSIVGYHSVFPGQLAPWLLGLNSAQPLTPVNEGGVRFSADGTVQP